MSTNYSYRAGDRIILASGQFKGIAGTVVNITRDTSGATADRILVEVDGLADGTRVVVNPDELRQLR
jgi:hypothetical protein